MYLKELDYAQKVAFFKLANELINADGKIEESESDLMLDYQIEMGFAIKGNLSHGEAIDIFKLTDNVVRKKVILELVGLALVDSCVQTEEEMLLKTIAKELDIEEGFIGKSKEYLEEYLDLISTINTLVNE